jgi:hypothetical protein
MVIFLIRRLIQEPDAGCIELYPQAVGAPIHRHKNRVP